MFSIVLVYHKPLSGPCFEWWSQFPISSFLGRSFSLSKGGRVANSVQHVTFTYYIRPEASVTGSYLVYDTSSRWHTDLHFFPIKFPLRAVLGWVPLITMEGVRGEWIGSLWPHAFLGFGILSPWLKDIDMVEVMNGFLLLDVCYSPRCLFPCKPDPLAYYSFYVPPHPSNIFSFRWRKQSQVSVPCHQEGWLLTLAVRKTPWV